MDRYAILLKKKIDKNQDWFSKKIREIFGTKYPIRVIATPVGSPVQSLYENFLFYDMKNEMFSTNRNMPGKQLIFFPLKIHDKRIKEAFKAVEVNYHFKCVHISRWGSSDHIAVELPIDDKRKKSMENNFNRTFGSQAESDAADYNARPGYGR